MKSFLIAIFLCSIVNFVAFSQTDTLYVPTGNTLPTDPVGDTYRGIGINVRQPTASLDIASKGSYGTTILLRGGGEWGEATLVFTNYNMRIGNVVGRTFMSGSLGIENYNRGIILGSQSSSIYIGGEPDMPPSEYYKYGKNILYGLTRITDSLIISEASPNASGFFIPQGFKFGVNVPTAFNQYVSFGGANCIPADANIKVGVKGKVYCEGLRIKMAGTNCWADYVFDKNYRLLPLSDVKQYIQNNKHLPGIPSAEEVKKEGLEVEDMLKLQMQKIEELTLYVIQLQEEMAKLKEKK